jgi:TolB-like protein/DNA-binding winged helix-turn-helix (wHTH) protein/Flp pilus assembly protein TadD
MDGQSFLAGMSIPSQTQQNQRPSEMSPLPCAVAQTRSVRHTGPWATLGLRFAGPGREPIRGSTKLRAFSQLVSAMRQANDPSGRLRFGVFEVDPRAGELTKRGLRIRLQEQPFQILAMLLEKPGELVTREELREKIWGQTVVDFDHGLNKAINKIREALGDSAENPRFVETVARRGYRFLADVIPIDTAADRQPGPETEGLVPPTEPQRVVPADEGAPPKQPHRAARVWTGVGLGVALAIAASLYGILYVQSPFSPKIRSLAVLPLESLSSDASQDYFADGMTDALIADLGQISALRVISRTSTMTYKRVHRPLAEIARELNVEAVVEGTVLRSGERVRITAQLIQVPNERHLWAQSYEGDLQDTLALQNNVARAIAKQIQVTLNPQEEAALEKSKKVNAEAYEAYLKGRYFWNKRSAEGLKRAIDYFEHAIDRDPDYARAYSGLADSYALLGDWEYGILSPQEAFPKAKAAATRALALDDNLSEAHTSLAFILDLYDWGWASAEKEYKRALALNPGYATAHHWYAWHLIVTGRNNEGIAELKKAESLDPLSLIISADLADALCIAQRYDESVRQSQKTIEMDPHFAVGHYQLGQALEQKHRHDEAIAEFRRAIELSGGNTTFESNLANAYAVSGRTEEAMRIVEDLESRQSQGSSTDASIALVYVGLGDNARAMTWLNKAYQVRFNPSILMRPVFDPLRSDPRFQDLLNRIGLPGREPSVR